MPTIAIAAVAAGAAVIGTGASIYFSTQQAKEQRRASRYERQKADLQAANQKRDAIRSARQAYADAQSAAENQGVADSSGAAGGQGSIASQLNSNLSFLDQYGYYSDRAGAAMGKASGYQSQASMWGSIAKLGETGYGMSGGLKGVIGPKPPKLNYDTTGFLNGE